MAENSKVEVSNDGEGTTNIKLTIYPVETVPCTWCGTQTTYTYTQHCDNCHELDKRISDRPELAARMVGYYAAKQDIDFKKVLMDILAGQHQQNDEQYKTKKGK